MPRSMKQLFLLICATFILHSAFATEIDTSMYVSIGGIVQFFQIEGADATKPILLYVHGGPGQATSPKEYEVLNELSQDYVVVYWAQRNAGQTLERNKDTSTVSLAVVQQDAEEVLLWLLDNFDREQVTLVANSWGNFLAFGLIRKYPSSIKRYVAISPNIHALKSQHQYATCIYPRHGPSVQVGEYLQWRDRHRRDDCAVHALF